MASHSPTVGSSDSADPADLSTLDRATRADLTRAAHERLLAGEPAPAGVGPREQLILLNMPVAASIAARYRNRGIAQEDLSQVAYLALVKAARNFDETSGHDFLSYAVPTIRGEVLRHFRDHGWTIRPPRRIQELQTRITVAEDELAATKAGTPTQDEVAEHLGETPTAVREALGASGCFAPTSLDRPAIDGSGAIVDLLGEDDTGYVAAEARVLLTRAVRRLSTRDRRALVLRYYRGLTQAEIADELGLTQAQVSRLLARVLAELREAMDAR